VLPGAKREPGTGSDSPGLVHLVALWVAVKDRGTFARAEVDVGALVRAPLFRLARVYIGFAVADGRPKVIAVETGIASIFVVIAAIAVTGSVWLIVLGLNGHGLKDLWQHRRQFVANTRWWPPFCLVVDWVAATIIAIAIIAGVDFQ
jgi:hypothetical protein